MQSFRYRNGYNLMQAGSMALGAILMTALWWTSGHLMTLAVAVVLAVCATISARRIGGSDPALSFDSERVMVRTPFGVSEFPWTDVTSIYLQTRSASNIATIPFGGSLCVCFQTTNSGLIGGRVWLGTSAIELPPGGPGALLDELNRTWRAATGQERLNGVGDALPV